MAAVANQQLEQIELGLRQIDLVVARQHASRVGIDPAGLPLQHGRHRRRRFVGPAAPSSARTPGPISSSSSNGLGR